MFLEEGSNVKKGVWNIDFWMAKQNKLVIILVLKSCTVSKLHSWGTNCVYFMKMHSCWFFSVTFTSSKDILWLLVSFSKFYHTESSFSLRYTNRPNLWQVQYILFRYIRIETYKAWLDSLPTRETSHLCSPHPWDC